MQQIERNSPFLFDLNIVSNTATSAPLSPSRFPRAVRSRPFAEKKSSSHEAARHGFTTSPSSSSGSCILRHAGIMTAAKIVALVVVLAASVPMVNAEGSSVTFYTDAGKEWCVSRPRS